MALGKDEEWILPENLRRQEKAEIARVEGGGDASGGDFGAYYALLKRGDAEWVRRHAIIDEREADSYAAQAAEALAAAVSVPEKPSILDIGCGPGALTEALRRRFSGSRATGLDISESAVAYAKRRYPECRFEVAAIEESARLPGTYDLIHAREFYPFTRTGDIDTHRGFLRLLAAHLSDGGALLIALAAKPGSLEDTLHRLSGDLPGLRLSPFSSSVLASAFLAGSLPLSWARSLTRIGKAALRRPCTYLHVASRRA